MSTCITSAGSFGLRLFVHALTNEQVGSNQYHHVLHRSPVHARRSRQIHGRVADALDHALHPRCQAHMRFSNSRPRRGGVHAAQGEILPRRSRSRRQLLVR